MATLTAQAVGIAGTTITFVAAAGGGDAVAPAPNQVLRIKNGGGSPITVTLIQPGFEYGVAKPDPPIVVAAAAEVDVILPPEFADYTTGLVPWTYSGVTSVTVAVTRT